MEDVNGYMARVKPGENQIKMVTGQRKHYVVNLASGTFTVPDELRGCRYVRADVEGIIRVGYYAGGGTLLIETKPMVAGEQWLVGDVAFVYETYGTSPADCSTQVYTDTGDLVTGLKLLF